MPMVFPYLKTMNITDLKRRIRRLERLTGTHLGPSQRKDELDAAEDELRLRRESRSLNFKSGGADA